VSEFIREGLCRAFPEIADRTMTIYDGVEPQEFPHEPVVPEVPRIVYVGQVSPHKGVHDLIAAFIQLTAELPEATLTIIGPQGAYPLDEVAPVADRETRRRLEPYYSDAGHVRNFAPHYLDALRKQIPPELVDRITFTGQVSRAEVLSRLRHARVAAFPSLWNEGFGMPPVEAMASGTPVVATRSGGVVETVLDGTTGLLVEKGDVPGLVRALSRILSDDDLCTAMSTAARAHALGHFAWPVIAEHAACTYGRARSTTDGSRGKPSVEPLAAAAVTVAPVGG
jgi:glycosyltransferase involved in cell wall biosynthesis